jgi:hypothetical protein
MGEEPGGNRRWAGSSSGSILPYHQHELVLVLGIVLWYRAGGHEQAYDPSNTPSNQLSKLTEPPGSALAAMVRKARREPRGEPTARRSVDHRAGHRAPEKGGAVAEGA